MSNISEESARRAGRLAARRAGRLALVERAARRARERAALTTDHGRTEAALEHDGLAGRLNEDDRRETARLADQEADRLAEQDQRESRRTTPMSFALRGDLKDRLTRFRAEGGNINVSGICNDAIERELDRIESGNVVVQRLRVELTERRGPSWTMGYQAGRKWAEEVASWLEITGYATQYTDADVKVERFDESGFGMWVDFRGPFRAPVRDYGTDEPQQSSGAPSFRASADDADPKWEYQTWELEAYWRAWLQAVREVYGENKAHLPSVIERLPAQEASRPRDVDPDEIPF